MEKIHNTLKSRATIYYIRSLNKNNSILWLQEKNKNKSNQEIKTAFCINKYSLIKSHLFLNGSQILQRKKLMNIIKNYVLDQDINVLFSLLYYNNTSLLITWICHLLIDVIKFNIFKKKDVLCNPDQYDLIKKLSKKIELENLYENLMSWIKCQYILKKIPYIDKKLMLTEQTLCWNYLLNNKK
ncbi:DNA polymerase III subunit delta' C-terminal domain-containing protein [Buchnera aphidicola]|uniref:DNA polymerase III subunit delta' C-terminal domain-containing protein n=1 Tax=Buchnera aphidicola TaxID=9 RepID=UPI00094D70D8|nr:DNA polymerase III subunit delta' C-terminal domain-containing protein [Buchnera aphidicola]